LHAKFYAQRRAKPHLNLAIPWIYRDSVILRPSWFVGQGFCVAAGLPRQGGLSEDTGGVTGNTQRGHISWIDDAMKGNPEKLLFRKFLGYCTTGKIVMEMQMSIHTRGATEGARAGL